MLYNQGKSAITEYQIIAAIPVDKVREILALADFRLSELARWDMEWWLKIAGIVYAKATALVTSFELVEHFYIMLLEIWGT